MQTSAKDSPEEKSPEDDGDGKDEKKVAITEGSAAAAHAEGETPNRSLLHELYKDDPNAPSGSRQLRCNSLFFPSGKDDFGQCPLCSFQNLNFGLILQRDRDKLVKMRKRKMMVTTVLKKTTGKK